MLQLASYSFFFQSLVSTGRSMDVQEVVVQYKDPGHGNDKRRLVVSGGLINYALSTELSDALQDSRSKVQW